ncbi:MAG TPA: hypothetical protein VHZ02_01460 [Acidimicrobiales bacterium]|jgi:hypothetical protein|nr:hypothetical protein [Acidimicrobiales bacterium]
MRRIVGTALGTAVLVGTMLFGGTAAFAQSGGAIKLISPVNASDTGNKPIPVVFTGAVGDYGTTVNVNAAGKNDTNGNFTKVTLKKGGFTVDSSSLNAAFNSSGAPADFNSDNCSGSISVGPATATIVSGSGTGSYKGISGSVDLTATVAVILPKKNGSCNTSNNANALAAYGVLTGSGTVSFGS